MLGVYQIYTTIGVIAIGINYIKIYHQFPPKIAKISGSKFSTSFIFFEQKVIVVRADNALNIFVKIVFKNISFRVIHILYSDIKHLHFLHTYFVLKNI
jgi:hypothetical protein